MSGPAAPPAPRRVVIAEDEALIRMDLKEMLEEAGYAVVGEAGDGETAVRLAAELTPDLVVLDVKMPVLDGQKADLVPAIEIAVARHEQMAALSREVADLTDRLETRKLVDRAKAVLQERHGMSEAEAFRWIQKSSMDMRVGMRQVAQTVLDQDADPGPGGTPVGEGPSGS